MTKNSLYLFYRYAAGHINHSRIRLVETRLLLDNKNTAKGVSRTRLTVYLVIVHAIKPLADHCAVSASKGVLADMVHYA
ncbi:hypothetical protein NNL21_31340 [Paenibacillus mendelii]|nr:hypothetical protein [Paenibacillus mendelii]